MNDTQDVLDLVRAYAPTPASVAREWSLAQDDQVLARIRQGDAEADVIPLHFLAPPPTRRHRTWSRLLPVAASAAVLALAAGVLVTVLPRDGGSPAGGAGTAPFAPPAGLSARADVGAGQFSYRVTEQIALDAQGRPEPRSNYAMTMRDYVSTGGDVVSRRTGRQTGCFSFPNGGVGFTDPTRAFFAAMPTDVPGLTAYLRSHVDGSSSRDEAMFVAVGDALRDGNALASPRLRAAMVAVLSRTPGVTLHRGDQDYLGRAALRLDFVDQRIRPGEVQSMYFDPDTFGLLEERSGATGQPSTYAGPSPAYDAHAPGGSSPARLGYPASVSVMRTEQVADSAPAC